MFLQTRHPDCDNEGYWRHPVGAAPTLLLAGDAQLLAPGAEQSLHHLLIELLRILTFCTNIFKTFREGFYNSAFSLLCEYNCMSKSK